MFSKTKLRGKIAENGLNQEKLAQAIGISHVSLSKKINGNTDFTLKEVNAIAKTLKLSNEDIIQIFIGER